MMRLLKSMLALRCQLIGTCLLVPQQEDGFSPCSGIAACVKSGRLYFTLLNCERVIDYC